MAKTYELTIQDDALAQEFEAGLQAAGLTVETLFEKEVGDFVQSARQATEEAKKSPVTRPDTEGTVTVTEK